MSNHATADKFTFVPADWQMLLARLLAVGRTGETVDEG